MRTAAARRRSPVAAAALLLLLLAASLAPTPARAEADDAARAVAWLASQRTSTGHFRGVSAANVVEAAAAVGLDPASWPSPDESALAALTPPPASNSAETRYNAHLRIAHALGSAGYDPRQWAHGDLVQIVRDGFRDGQFGSPIYVNDDMFAILALRGAGVPADDPQVQASAAVIEAARKPDGGWGFATTAPSSTDITGFALAALSAAGRDLRQDERAAAFLATMRDPITAGYRYDAATAHASCQSTTWALHSLHLLGEDASGAASFLRSLQTPSGGLKTTAAAREPDTFCTAEAAIALAGARYPLARYQPARVAASPHALEPARLWPEGGFTSARFSFEDARVQLEGNTAIFPLEGEYRYRIDARGPGIAHRGTGALQVLGALPRLGALPVEVVTHRGVPVSLDLRNASDPDGRIVATEVDWGDGNVSAATTHAYAALGRYTLTVRVQDDDGAWSRPATATVLVQNRAPVVAPLPARILADRVSPLALSVSASDADGDAVALQWSFQGEEGSGAPALTPRTLGASRLEIVATDAHGALANASIEVEVVNLPPRVVLHLPAAARAGESVELRAEAQDADGPAPALAWSVAGARATGPLLRLRAPEGATSVTVTATDADGATAQATATLVAAAPEEETRSAPEIRVLEAELADSELRVRYEATEGALATLAWTSDVGSGEMQVEGDVAIPLPGATWARATLTVEREGLRASQETDLLLAAPREEPTPVALPPAPAPETTTVSAARLEAPAPPEPTPQPAPLESTAIEATPRAAPRQETPAPAPWLALALALLATRGRRAW